MAEMEYYIHKYLLLVFNHLKIRTVVFCFLRMEPYIYRWSGSAVALLVSTEAQNGQTALERTHLKKKVLGE